ncbi:MAG: efflux RND transporter permease subunit [Nitratireductor sp.]|nr:efflux RND transporter permease subunit [Nitratireductor sp.]
MDFLTSFGLQKSRLTLLFMAVLLALGVGSYFNLSKREDPSITIRTVVVSAFFPGMAPDRLEDLIVVPIERKAREIAEVDTINTLISTGSTIIKLEVSESLSGDAVESVFDDIRVKMEEVSHDLPDGTRGPFVNTDYGNVAIASIAVTGEGFSYSEIRDSAESLQRALYTLEGIGKISLYGEQEERIWLELDSRKLAAVGVQINQVLADLQSQNVILPAGDIDADGTTIILEANGDLQSVDAIRQILTKVSGLSGFVRLEDLVTVRRGYEEPHQKPVYFNGQPAVMLGVEMSAGEDIQKVGRQIRALVERQEATQPIGISYTFSTYQEEKVTSAINDALVNVAQTIAVVLLVMLLFLGVRSAIIIACIVPFTVMFALVVMGYLDIELQQVSIAAVIISLGLLVDNGLVVVEDIQNRVSSGADPSAAARAAGKQFTIPLAVASVTTVSAFLPLLLLEGTEGEYGFSLGAVVAAMLVGSWLTALYILPALAVWLSGKPKADESSQPGRLVTLYGKSLNRSLAWSIPLIAVCYLAVILSGSFFSGIKKEMFPLSARNQFLIYLDMPRGTSIARTEQEALAVEAWLSDKEQNPEITNTTVYVGDGGPRFYLALSPADANPASAFILVNTDTFDGALAASGRAERYLLENHPAARFKTKRLAMGGSESGIVEVKLSGADADRLLELAGQVEAAFAGAPGIVQNENDWGNKSLKIVVNISQDQARELGVTSEDISEIMNTFFAGTQVSDYREGTDSIPIVIRLAENFRDSIEDLSNLSVAANGQLISLDRVATFVPKLEYSQLRRENQQRLIKISGKSGKMSAVELLAFISADLEKLDLPEGYNLKIDGETARSAEVNAKLAAGVPAALAVMLLALTFQFNSARRVLLTFLTIPLVLIGAPLALLVTGQPLSFFAILGLISLAGIIINNAIVLIDQIDADRQSMALKEAIVSAAQKRVTPIMLTSLTTIFGLIPMAVAGGALFEPMATLMIGGLAVASVMTLFFVPSGYYLLFRGR